MSGGARDAGSRSLARLIALRSAPMTPMPTDAEPRLAPLAGIRAVLFDVYGTLFISGAGDIGLQQETARPSAMTAALRAAGFEIVNEAAGTRAVDRLMEKIGAAHRRQREAGGAHPEVDIRELWPGILCELESKGLIGSAGDELQQLRLAVEYEARVNPTWPMPGLEPLLAGLTDRKNVLGIVSNAQFFTPLLFEAHTGRSLPEWGFAPDLCLWSFEHRTAKPGALLFELALDRLHREYAIGADEVLVVGNDRVNDIVPAASLGCRTALFAGDRRSYRPRPGDPRVPGIEPDVLLTLLGQIIECLQT